MMVKNKMLFLLCILFFLVSVLFVQTSNPGDIVRIMVS